MNKLLGKYRIKEKQTLNQKVYNIIKEMIIKGDLKAGDKLNEVEIAEHLGVSATPVRETYRMLATEGLLEVIPYRGVFVREYTIEEIKEVYQCRKALENLAIELSYEKLDKQKLEQLLKKVKSVNKNDDHYKIGNDIHNLILESAGNQKLLDLTEQLNYILLHNRNISAYDGKRQTEIKMEHEKLLMALIDKDEIAAKNAMTEHIENGFKYIQRRLNSKE